MYDILTKRFKVLGLTIKVPYAREHYAPTAGGMYVPVLEEKYWDTEYVDRFVPNWIFDENGKIAGKDGVKYVPYGEAFYNLVRLLRKDAKRILRGDFLCEVA